MEALAIRDGAILAEERGYTRVVIERDAKEVVNLCNRDDQNRSDLMAICQEIRDIKRAFSTFSISLIGREANNAAHFCAKQASSDMRRCQWVNNNTGFLANTLHSDRNPVI
jgi:hypothetical protein